MDDWQYRDHLRQKERAVDTGNKNELFVDMLTDDLTGSTVTVTERELDAMTDRDVDEIIAACA